MTDLGKKDGHKIHNCTHCPQGKGQGHRCYKYLPCEPFYYKPVLLYFDFFFIAPPLPCEQVFSKQESLVNNLRTIKCTYMYISSSLLFPVLKVQTLRAF